MNKKLFLVFTLLSLLVLSSCQYGPRVYPGPQTTDFYSGTDGLTVEFLDQAPPREVFETSEFDVQLYVHNKGAFSITQPYGVVVDLTYDSSKVERITNYDFSESQNQQFNVLDAILGSTSGPTNQIIGDFQIEGKNVNWRDGEQQYIMLARFRAKEITGNFQTNNVAFITRLCYPYQTNFASEICIDTDTQGTSQRDEVCEQQDYSYGGGQGAPIAITAVETQMIPRGVYVQPQFTIHIELKGNGVISYRELDAPYSTALCEDIPTENINKISARAFLGDKELTCLPQDIILRGGEAKIQCQLDENSILGVSSNYQTSLSVQLGYQYTESFKKDIVVQKSQGTIFDDGSSSDSTQCFSWQTYDQSQSKCVNTCNYLASTNQNYADFENIKVVMNQQLADTVDQDYLWSQVACNYKSSTICKDNPELCILQNGLCPPNEFCGLPQCLLKNNRPQMSDIAKIGLDRLSFYCIDSDDNTNIQQTCGCIDRAYYGFIPDNETCTWPSSYSQVSEGTRQNLFGIQHNIDGLNDENKEGSKLCIMVKDKLDANYTVEYYYPFRI